MDKYLTLWYIALYIDARTGHIRPKSSCKSRLYLIGKEFYFSLNKKIINKKVSLRNSHSKIWQTESVVCHFMYIQPMYRDVWREQIHLSLSPPLSFLRALWPRPGLATTTQKMRTFCFFGWLDRNYRFHPHSLCLSVPLQMTGSDVMASCM